MSVERKHVVLWYVAQPREYSLMIILLFFQTRAGKLQTGMGENGGNWSVTSTASGLDSGSEYRP